MGNKHQVREIEGAGKEYVRGLGSFLFSLIFFVAIAEGKQRAVITAFNMPFVSAFAVSLAPDESLKGDSRLLLRHSTCLSTRQLPINSQISILSQDKKTFFLTTRAIAPSFLSDYNPAPPTQSSFPP